jgi:hypothetical protein
MQSRGGHILVPCVMFPQTVMRVLPSLTSQEIKGRMTWTLVWRFLSGNKSQTYSFLFLPSCGCLMIVGLSPEFMRFEVKEGTFWRNIVLA